MNMNVNTNPMTGAVSEGAIFNARNSEVVKLHPVQQLRFWGLIERGGIDYKSALTHPALTNIDLYYNIVQGI